MSIENRDLYLSICKKALTVGFLVYLLALASTYAEQSKGRIFWNDEGIELADTCNLSHLTLLFKGAIIQASPSPLHYNIQKIVFPALTSFDVDPLIAARTISIFSILACALLVFAFLKTFAGLETAYLAAASLFTPILMGDFATQTRPYQLWNLLFAISILLVAWNPEKLWLSARFLGIWIIFCLCLTLVSLVGFLQASAILFGATTLYFWEKRRLPKKWPALLITQFIFMALTYRYAQVRDADPDSDTFQFFTKHGTQWDLLKGILRLYFPKQDIFFNSMALLGLAYPLKGAKRNLKHLGFLLWLQLLSVGVITALVLWQNYFLIQRLFLNVIICRSLFIGLGYLLFLELVNQFLSAKNILNLWPIKIAKLAAILIALVSLYSSWSYNFHKGRAMVNNIDRFWLSERSKINCSDFEGLRAGFVIDRSMEQLWGVYPNTANYFSKVTQDCPQKKGIKLDRWIYVESSQTFGSDPLPQNFKIVKEMPTNGIQVKICGIEPKLEW